jgi:hypothetical protein
MIQNWLIFFIEHNICATQVVLIELDGPRQRKAFMTNL